MVDLPPIDEAKHYHLNTQEAALMDAFRQMGAGQRAAGLEAFQALAKHGGNNQEEHQSHRPT